ncbi:6916_t:CDS:1 [Ambispora gerdemannii]|uniref:6916_t:CDS:1 n=1 Tax=Ambispora gerdemannii TaxID=144530 RepID=A0A9N8ZPD1_9GLOM|nr:6916_t:CDS:1 [Ambispora gerdemannii]
MALNIMFNLSTGQLAALIGLISTLLPIIIGVTGAIVILRNIRDEMTALEWTTLSKLTQNSLLSSYGAGGQPALTGINLWGIGPYKRNIIYLLVGICPVVLYGASAIAPLGIQTCTVIYNAAVEMDVVEPDLLSRAVNDTFSLDELSQIRICGAYNWKPCPGMKDRVHVDETYAAEFNKTYSNNAMRYRLLKTSSNDNVSYPSYDFMMGVATSTQTGYNIIDRMIVDHDNGGLLMNQAIQPRGKVGKKSSWTIEGMWLQPYVSCQSTNITQIAWQNQTTVNWIAKMVINNTDLRPPDIHPLGDQGQMIDLSSRSIRYSQLIQSIVTKRMNMTANGNFFESPAYRVLEPKSVNSVQKFADLSLSSNLTNLFSNADIRCAGYGGSDSVAMNIVGVKCWTLFGSPKVTARGIEQIMYSCASAVKASLKDIELQSNEQKQISVMNMQTIPAQWYIEKANLNISDMKPWWGGVKSGENIPNNSILVSENSLWLPAGSSFIWSGGDDAQAGSTAIGVALSIITDFEDIISGYRGDGIGNLALLQQWKDEGSTEEGMSRIFQRQWTDVMVNMVSPTKQAKVTGPTQFVIEKTCYDIRFAIQYYIAIVGLLILLCVCMANTKRTNSLSRMKQIVRQMDLGRAILNTQYPKEASTADSSTWIKTDGRKLISMGKEGFILDSVSANPIFNSL